MKDSASVYYDVIVVGLGPTGATLANLLGQCGLSVLVLEREAEIYPLPRAVHFDDEVMRVFQTVGIADALISKLIVNKGMRFCDSEGNLLLDWPRPQSITGNGWNASYRFHQPDLEQALRVKLQQDPNVTIKSRHVVGQIFQDLTQPALPACVTYRNLETDSSSCATARYVVGCDGARSSVREQMQVDMQKLGFEQRWLVIDVLLQREMPVLGDYTLQFCNPDRPATYCRNFGNRRRWEFALQDSESDSAMLHPESVWRLLGSWLRPEDAELERCAVYTFKSEVAESWHIGRLFLAGDAAHLTPPFMGQGMCAGVRDAANLAWKLAHACRGDTEPGFLDSYTLERKSNVVEYIQKAVELGELINRMGRHAEAGDPRKMNSIDSRLKEGLGDREDRLRGLQFPQCRLRGGQLIDDLVGYRPVLLKGTSVKVPESFSGLQGDVSTISAKAEPSLVAVLQQLDTEVVMVRPDRYILASGRYVT